MNGPTADRLYEIKNPFRLAWLDTAPIQRWAKMADGRWPAAVEFYSPRPAGCKKWMDCPAPPANGQTAHFVGRLVARKGKNTSTFASSSRCRPIPPDSRARGQEARGGTEAAGSNWGRW